MVGRHRLAILMHHLREIPAVRMMMKGVIHYLTKGHLDAALLSIAVKNSVLPVIFSEYVGCRC